MKKVTLMKRPNTELFDKNIRQLEYYANAFDIFDNYYSKSAIDAMSENFKDYLQHANDGDSIAYYVLNNNTIVHADPFNGDIIGVQPLADFMHDVFKYYKEEYNGEW